MTRISNSVKVRTSTNFEDKIGKAAQRIVANRIERAKEIAEKESKKYVAEVLQRDRVFKSIGDDDAGESLAEHFGLDQSRGRLAQKLILEAVLSGISVKVISRTRSTKLKDFGIEMVITAPSTQTLISNLNLDDEPFAYNSTSTNKKIKKRYGTSRIAWMQWLLHGSRDVSRFIPSISDFGIAFGSDFENSRSGRAVMGLRPRVASELGMSRSYIDIVSSRVKFPYTLPSYAIPSRGNAANFIEAIYNSREFKEILTNIIIQKTKRIFKR